MTTTGQRETSTDAGMSKYDAIVVGAGVTGIYQVYRLREAGFSVLGIDAAGGIGGTWWWNRYPGCRFDSESYTYHYSFSDELLDEWNWSEHFSGQPETLSYLNHVVDKFDLLKNFQLNTRIKSAIFNEAGDYWTLETDDGQRLQSQFMIMTLGLLAAPQMPNIEGLDTFAGPSFHAARWPIDPNGLGGADLGMAGKRVGIIGSGATAVQMASELAKTAGKLTVFQRTPNWCAPLCNAKITDEEQPALKSKYPEIFKKCGETLGAFMHEYDPRKFRDVAPEDRQDLYERIYQEPGFATWLCNFKEVMYDDEANKEFSDFMAKKIRERVKDQSIATKLIPTCHGFGWRRVPMETNYYEIYNQDNVELVALLDTPIERVTPGSVITTENEYELDFLVLATGFDGATGGYTRIDIRGADGQTIQDKWSHGAMTYVGMQTEGFPNMFMHGGPHTVFCNIPRCAEETVDWVTDMLSHMRDKNLTRVSTTAEAEEQWSRHVADTAAGSFITRVDSWIMGANVEGKPRTFLMYSGGAPVYREKLQNILDNDYEGFKFGQP